MATQFTDGRVDAAIAYVIRHGAENRASLVHYTLVFTEAGMPAPQELHHGGESELVTRFMKAFHDRCVSRHLPPLDSLVVHVAGERGGVPGAGYFKVNNRPDPYGRGATESDTAQSGAFLQRQRESCRRWGDLSRRGRLAEWTPDP